MNWIKQQVANVAGTQEPIYGPSAIQSVAKQAEQIPYTELHKEDLKWAAMTSTCAETQTFYLMADNGHIGMAQVIYSNVAGIHTTCQWNTKIFYPNGKSPNLWSSDPLKNFNFDHEKLSCWADDCAITLSEDGTSYTVKSATNDASIVNLTITRTSPGFHVGKDGKSYFGTDPKHPWGSMRHGFWPRCQAEGSIITNAGEVNFKGRAFFVHALQGMKPHHAGKEVIALVNDFDFTDDLIAAKWNFVNFQSPNYSAVMMEYTTPPSYGSTIVNVGGIATDGEILCAGSRGNSVEHTKVTSDRDNEWPEPEAVKYVWGGVTKDKKAVSATLAGSLGRRLDKVDVLAKIPGFIKTIVGGVVGTKPYIYQYAPQQKLSITVKLDGVETTEEGDLFTEATFIS